MELDNLYLFTGVEEPVIKVRINRLIDDLSKTKSTITKYDLDITPIKDIIKDAITIPFLTDQKIFILKNPKFLGLANIKEDFKELNKYLLNPSESTIIIIDATNIEINNDNPTYQILRKRASIIDIKKLEEIELGGILIRKLALKGLTIKDDALKLFLNYLNHNLVRAEQEIEKIALYKDDTKVVTVEDIKLLVSTGVEDDIFSLASAIISKDRVKTMNIYNNLMKNTNDALGILGMICRAFIELYLTSKLLMLGYSNQDIATITNISKGRVYYLSKDVKSFKIDELGKIINSLAKLDYKIKTGQINKNLGLELLLLKI